MLWRSVSEISTEGTLEPTKFAAALRRQALGIGLQPPAMIRRFKVGPLFLK